MTSIKDVALKAKVSIATVSRVLNNNVSVKEDTRKRVLAAVEDLNYTPNFVARNLRKSQTKTILVLIPSISNVFYGQVLKGIEDKANEEDYNILLCNTESDIKREQKYLNLVRNNVVDGIILTSTEMSYDKIDSLSERIPVVQCSEYNERSKVPAVTIDNKKAAYDAFSYLTGLGYKKIGLVTSEKKYKSSIQRLDGYKKALKDAKIKFNSNYISEGIYNYKGGKDATYRLLRAEPDLEALFCISDMFAAGAISSAKELGYKVPEDLSIVGFDNVSISYMITPPITTISQPRYEIGYKAMEIILNELKNSSKETGVTILEHKLIVRESTIKVN